MPENRGPQKPLRQNITQEKPPAIPGTYTIQQNPYRILFGEDIVSGNIYTNTYTVSKYLGGIPLCWKFNLHMNTGA